MRGTTLTLACDIEGIAADSISAKDLYITLEQPTVEITKSGNDITRMGDTFYVDLSQRDTLRLKRGTVAIQARFKDVDGYYWATTIAIDDVESVLYEKEIK